MSISILFYNTHLFGSTLPGTFIGGQGFHDSKRNEAIATYILNCNADIVCLCEVWDKKFKRDLISTLKETYPYTCSNARKSVLTIGSGLMIFSKHSLYNAKFSSLPHLSGMDAFAEKGVLQVCVQLNTKQQFRLFVTHNQATPDPSNCRERNSQFIADLARQYFPGSPAIILGDLNIYSDGDEYRKMMSSYADFVDSDANTTTQITYDIVNNSLAKRFANNLDRSGKLDYILHSLEEWHANSFEVITNWIHSDYDCSDHYPVRSTLSLLKDECRIPEEYQCQEDIYLTSPV